MKLGVRKPSPAMVVACLALLVALSGVSYAAIKLPRGSVGTPQLKKNAVTSPKVKDGSLLAGDFAPGQIPPGPQGLQGVQGIQGLQGEQGEPGRSALTPLQSGDTISGVIGGQFETAAGEFRVLETFPIPAPVAVPNANVDVDEQDEPVERCGGTATAPTAPAGVVCIYIQNSLNASDFIGIGAPNVTTGSQFGFGLKFDADSAGDARVVARWAYQAP